MGFSVMNSENYSSEEFRGERFNGRGIVQRKVDGVRAEIVYRKSDNTITAFSRSGGEFKGLDVEILRPYFEEMCSIHKEYFDLGAVLSVELAGSHYNKKLNQQASANANRLLAGKEISQEEIEKICYFVFDLVSLDEFEGKAQLKLQQKDRMEIMRSTLNSEKIEHPSRVQLVDFELVDEQGLLEFFDEYVRKGGEGVVVKNPYVGYYRGKTSHWLKMKATNDCDLEITDFIKERSTIVGLIASTADRLARTPLFLNDMFIDRVNDESDSLIGKIVKVRYEECFSLGEQVWGFSNPILVEIREDKKKADTIHNVKKKKQ